MRLEHLAAWLRCPICHEDLTPAAHLVLGCTNGHRFDVNKRGYATLLGAHHVHSGDTPAMLDARERVLEAGTYSPIAAAIATAARDAAAARAHAGSARALRVIDAGVGTGYYLRTVLACDPGWTGLGLDVSAQAVQRAVRHSDRVDGLVADTWKPLPVRTGTCDLLLNVFAPRNIPEFARALVPHGELIVVVPRADHLREVRSLGRMLDVPAAKAEELILTAAPEFELKDREHLRFSVPLDSRLIESLADMGPAAFHTAGHGKGAGSPAAAHPEAGASDAEAAAAEATEATEATVSVDILRFTKR